MFNKIKKSKLYKATWISTLVFVGIGVFLGMLSLVYIMAEIGWGGLLRNKREMRIENVFDTTQADSYTIKSTTITLVDFNENETGIETKMICVVDVLDEINISYSSGEYYINKVYVDETEIEKVDNNYTISITGTHTLKFLITYETLVDIYEDYKAIKVENKIENSTLVLSDKFKIEQQDDLLKKNEIFNVYDADSTFIFTNYIMRHTVVRITQIYLVVLAVFICVIVGFIIVVSIGAKKENKRAAESAQAN